MKKTNWKRNIDKYFDTNCSGMLKVFKYEEGNKSGFLKLVSELPSILDKIEFITYNTLQAFRGEKKFTYILTSCLKYLSKSFINLK